jgi:hypothetical protein
MSFGSDHQAWDAIDAHVRACGGDPRAGGLDAILTRRAVVACVDAHVEGELETLEKAIDQHTCSTTDDSEPLEVDATLLAAAVPSALALPAEVIPLRTTEIPA